MESPFASWMDRYALEYPHLAPKKDTQDSLATILQQRGIAHENQIEENFRKQGLSVVKIESKNSKDTLFAMKQGVDVILQAPLGMKDFEGFADFLVKVPGKSHLGNFHYEVWDAKLTKQLKPSHIIQLCCYTDMLEAIQGIRPTHIKVVLGNEEEKQLKTNDYFHYYTELKKAFLSSQASFDPTNMPDPADYSNYGNWSSYAEKELIEKDHLFQIANITRGQIKRLNKLNIQTTLQLVDTEIEHASGLNPSTFHRLKKQASIQKASRNKNTPHFEVHDHETGKKQGLALLPPQSSSDVFFDIEGFPFYENGLEYLWGCTYFTENRQRDFKDFWAHDKEEEKQAFQDFIKWVYDRWLKDPTMHIFHYGNYEIAVCRRLMGKYGVCEEEVDQLLRNEVFVDLYKIVKGSILLGEPRYSIKNVERLYRSKRKTEVGSGGDSVVAYEEWRKLNAIGEEGRTWQKSTILKSIRDYNIDDCDSTQELTDWLRERQKEQRINFIGKTEVTAPDIKEEITERTQLRDRLLNKAKQQATSDPRKAKVTENLAWILEFHRREEKPKWWRFFDRLGLSHEELIDDPDCLANCQRTNRKAFALTIRTRKLAYEYHFDPAQEFKGTTNDYILHGEENEVGKNISVTLVPEESNLDEGLLVLQCNSEPGAVISLIPSELIPTDVISKSLTQVVRSYDEDKLQDSAIIDFLHGSRPRIKGHVGGPIVTSEDPVKRLEEIIQAVENLNNSYLTIQGPPGAGKTFTAMQIIARLVNAGYKVGISSNSHKAINNLLLNTVKYCKENQIKAFFACTKQTETALLDEGVIITENSNLASLIKPSCVLGTTVWGFARDDMVNKLDYLFIDEAGQVAVANLIGMSRCAKNIVLLGDQMQLGQPMQGTHPAESGLSILGYLLHDLPTIPEEMGIFLGTTYRMHPELNNFISEHIYEGKLKPHSNTIKRIISVPEGYHDKLNKEAGIIYIPVHHEGNTYSSDEEVAEIKKITHALLEGTLTTIDNNTRKIGWNDILFVTPYNYQARKLKEALGDHAKVGSVDKFQGQEAPIVILSMCTSDASESPRGLDFLLNRNRLNVAISRAQSLAIIVSNPNLAKGAVTNIEQLELINLFTTLSEYGQIDASASPMNLQNSSSRAF